MKFKLRGKYLEILFEGPYLCKGEAIIYIPARKVKKATKRNRLKRIIKEGLRGANLLETDIKAKYIGASTLDELSIKDELKRLLNELQYKCLKNI